MRDLVLNILKADDSLKVVELALAVWAHRHNIDLKGRGVWTPTAQERQEIQKIERALRLLLLELEEEGIVEISPEPQYFKWARLRRVS